MAHTAAEPPLWDLVRGDGPIIATAIHNGHFVREEVAGLLALDEAGRLREEDPYTGVWTEVGHSRTVVWRSRFEVDLNRPRHQAIYRRPEDAWGLEVWKEEPPAKVVEESLAIYDLFYSDLRASLDSLAHRHSRFVLLDLHSYNHRRSGPEAPAEEATLNPEVNIGTGSMDRDSWAPLVERFMSDLRHFDFLGRRLDVRENVRFRGGYLSRWVHENYPGGCALAIEFKKFFMDEWTGTPHEAELAAITEALAAAIPGLLEELAAG